MASACRSRRRAARRGCSRARGDDIRQGFPGSGLGHWRFDAVLDGELLVVRDGAVAPFADLQQRLNRKTVTRAMLTKYPVHVRLYDALEIGGEDLRGLSLRRRGAGGWKTGIGRCGPRGTDLSELAAAVDSEGGAARASGRTRASAGIEGLMLKRRDSPYLAGRPKGHWYKWKRAALTADCVLIYAQRGAGKRSSFYSDYTFGAWAERDGPRCWCRWARPIPASPMRSSSSSTASCATTRWSASARCAR